MTKSHTKASSSPPSLSFLRSIRMPGTFKLRRLIVLVFALLSFAVIHHQFWNHFRLLLPTTLDSPPSAEASESKKLKNYPTTHLSQADPRITQAHLSVTLNYTDKTIPSNDPSSLGLQPHSPPTIRVTIINYHQTSRLSILMWSTPFDTAALTNGIFQISDRATKKPLSTVGSLRVARLLAPRRRQGDLRQFGDGSNVPSDGGEQQQYYGGHGQQEEDWVELLPRHAVTKDLILAPPDVFFQEGETYDIVARGRWRAVWHADGYKVEVGLLKRMGGGTGLVDWDYETNVFSLDIPVTSKTSQPVF